MKNLAWILLLVLPTGIAHAQKVDLDKMEDGTTTYEISKNKKNSNCENQWEITDGSAEVTGEPNVMLKEANASWKKACEDWKKEFRADNKENKIINVSCNKPDCSSDAAGKVCVSKATYKVKTKLN
jgi:hypothetical protein